MHSQRLPVMKKAIVFSILGLALIIAVLVGIKAAQISALIENDKTAEEPPTYVSSFKVKQDLWTNTLSAISSLAAVKGLEVTADQPGRITKIVFSAGNTVKKDDLLIQQDISTEQAQLRSAQASVVLVQTNLERTRELYQKKVAAKAELDNAKSVYDSAVAEADNIRAIIEKKSIRAPFDGRLGIRLVNIGQTVSAGQSMVSLQAFNQMFANFSLPQKHLSKIYKQLPIQLTTDAIPGKTFRGYISTIDPEIDVLTRSIKIQALLDNPDQDLLPGIFASLDVLLPDVREVLLIPITAVNYAPFGDSVFLIEPNEDDPNKLTARQQFIKLGETRGDFVVVTNGLTEGQEVAGAGVFKLRNGAPVAINNEVAPSYSLNPVVLDQ
ncbi:MAG: membrane fusion protein (multidrug efflux system) [Cellvibrionaceae bacterium]|jgi:membrane fusion protein (multidrug efflux system)